ncbi:hypothetical protein FRC11_001116, partial [Ceratobasidium sp. 423]
MRYSPPKVGALLLYVDHQTTLYGAFFNTIQAAMRGCDIPFEITGRQIDQALLPDQSLCDWLGGFPPRSHLMVILITETSDNGWWTNGIGATYDRKETDLLWNLFVEDEDILLSIQ